MRLISTRLTFLGLVGHQDMGISAKPTFAKPVAVAEKKTSLLALDDGAGSGAAWGDGDLDDI